MEKLSALHVKKILPKVVNPWKIRLMQGGFILDVVIDMWEVMEWEQCMGLYAPFIVIDLKILHKVGQPFILLMLKSLEFV